MTLAAESLGAAREAVIPLIARVRAATSDAHVALERRLRLLDDDATLEHYRRFLHATLEVVSPLDGPLTLHLGDLYLLPGPDTRVTRLRDDLHSAAAGPAVPCALPVVASTAAAFGAGYVLQGSLLGGAVIVRHLSARFGAGAAGTRYLCAYGDALGPAWRRFTHSLDVFGQQASEGERRTVVDTAIQTFEAFGVALSRQGFGPS